MLTLVLPYPPSVNGYYATVGNRRIVSKRGLAYRQSVVRTVPRIRALEGSLWMDVDLYPPSKRRYDVDNTAKALLDALTHAGIWQDDSQVFRLCLTKRDVLRDGQAVVRIGRWDASLEAASIRQIARSHASMLEMEGIGA